MAEHLAHHGKGFNAKYIFNNFTENPETGEHTATAYLSPEHLAGAFGGSSDGDFLAAEGSEINKITIHDVGGLPEHSHCGIVVHHGEPGEDNFAPISTNDRHLVVDDSNPSVDGFHFSYSQSNATHSDSVTINHSKLADPKVLLAREDRWQGVLPEHVTAGVKTVTGDHPSGNGTSVTRIAIPKEHNGVQNGMYQLIEANKHKSDFYGGKYKGATTINGNHIMEEADYNHARDGLVEALTPVSKFKDGLNMTLVVNKEPCNPVHVRASFSRNGDGSPIYKEQAAAGAKKGAPITSDADFASAVLATTIGGRNASTAKNAVVTPVEGGGDAELDA